MLKFRIESWLVFSECYRVSGGVERGLKGSHADIGFDG